MSTTIDSRVVADQFLEARRTAAGLDGYPGPLPDTLEQAYAVQDEAIAHWNGGTIIGWKVGRVMPPLDARFGTDRLAGPIYLGREAGADGAPEMPVFAKGFAAGEAEFLLRLGAAPPAGKTDFTLDETADLIDAVHLGIEIASSPLGAINAIGPLAVVSDFGNNNGLVIGPAIADWRTSGFEDWEVTTLIDGAVVGTGRASAFPDGAIGAARFLLCLLAKRGIALSASQWISSGAVTGVHDAVVGQTVEARFGDAGSVRCRLVEARPQ